MIKLNLNPDPPANGGSGAAAPETSQQTIDRFIARVSELEGQLEKYRTAEAQREADEKLIREKMAQGLSRPQAINVIQRQRAFDATSEKSKVHPPSRDAMANRKSKIKK